MIDDRTLHLNLPLPSDENELEDDVLRLREALTILDSAHTFDSLPDKPTTLNGYGVTDAYTKTAVDSKITALVDDAPSNLNTLGEIASQLQHDEDTLASAIESLVSHIGSRGNAHGNATESTAGFMSASDKIKVDAFSGANYLPTNMLVVNIPPDAGGVTLAAGATDGALASVDGYGLYRYDSDDTTNPDGEFVIAPSSGTGNWILVAPHFDMIWAYLSKVLVDLQKQITG